PFGSGPGRFLRCAMGGGRSRFGDVGVHHLAKAGLVGARQDCAGALMRGLAPVLFGPAVLVPSGFGEAGAKAGPVLCGDLHRYPPTFVRVSITIYRVPILSSPSRVASP